MKTYRFTPADRCIRVHQRDHNKHRLLSEHPRTITPYTRYAMAQAILHDYRNHRTAAAHWREFCDEKIARLDMARHWELTGE